jgi:hypothetical protein
MVGSRSVKLRLVLMVAVLMLAMLAPAAAEARSKSRGNPDIFSPRSHPYGASYAEWAGDWLAWMLSFPMHGNGPDGFFNPFFVYTNDNCGVGQSGPVWFLGFGAAMGDGDVPRTCTVPAGKALLFSIGSSFCSPADGSPSDPAALKECAEGQVDTSIPLLAEIDGVRVKNPNRYYVSTPFTFTLPDDNFLQFVGAQPATPGNWYGHSYSSVLIVKPLPPGEHVIRIGDRDTVYVTWVITVSQRGR